MKYLVLILVVLVVLWLARGARRTVSRAPSPDPVRQSAAQEPMLACAQCGLHLPRDEALPGRGGVFCGEAHRDEYEKAHPVS